MKAWVLIIALLSAPAFAQSQRDGEAPSEFVAFIGGFLGRSYQVELVSKGQLIYSHNPRTFANVEYEGTVREKITVSDEQWRIFKNRLDKAKVWAWKPRYEDPKIADGTVWALDIDFGDHRAKASGSNAYPSGRKFEAYLKAVSELLGGREFK